MISKCHASVLFNRQAKESNHTNRKLLLFINGLIKRELNVSSQVMFGANISQLIKEENWNCRLTFYNIEVYNLRALRLKILTKISASL